MLTIAKTLSESIFNNIGASGKLLISDGGGIVRSMDNLEQNYEVVYFLAPFSSSVVLIYLIVQSPVITQISQLCLLEQVFTRS